VINPSDKTRDHAHSILSKHPGAPGLAAERDGASKVHRVHWSGALSPSARPPGMHVLRFAQPVSALGVPLNHPWCSMMAFGSLNGHGHSGLSPPCRNAQ